jgi:hypothetical protein
MEPNRAPTKAARTCLRALLLVRTVTEKIEDEIMTHNEKSKRQKLSIVLSVIFVFALVMGAGPGIYLVNPDPADPAATLTIWGGIPVIYAWVTFWYLVEATVTATAYFCLWKDR